MTFEQIKNTIIKTGLQLRAACHASEEDRIFLPENAKTILLLGFAGQAGWSNFRAAPENNGQPNPLDRWSKRVIGTLAHQFRAAALFPSDGPPYVPFLELGKRCGQMFTSPLGLLIDPEFGLWHSFRGALVFEQNFTLPENPASQNPCLSCINKPCLSACPVAAFSAQGYDVKACASHLHSPSQTCTVHGCLARVACPIGIEHRYNLDQTEFYMAAFKQAHIIP